VSELEAHLDEVPEEYRDPFSRAIAICTVVTTLLAGLVGYMLAVSSGRSSEAAAQAQHLSIQASAETVRAQQEAQADFETYVLAEEQRTRSSNAQQRRLFEQDPTESRHLEVRQSLWQLQAESTEKLTPLTATGEFGPEADPIFPARFYTNANREAYRLSALEDAANVTAGAWGSQAGGYTAVLTIFAVALYLFGLSLTLGQESQRLFAGVALALVSVGLVWTLLVFLRPPGDIPEEAADRFAAGEVAFRTAASQADNSAAADHFREVIDLRPDFALAHARLSAAEYRAGSPQTSGFVTFTDPKALDIAVTELERARELGLENFQVLTSLGAYHFQRGVFQDRPEDFAKSVEITEEALEIDPDSAHLKMNLGLGMFANGDEESARKYLSEGAQDADTFLTAATMGVLDLLQDKGPEEVAAAAPEMKEYLAGVTPSPIEDAPEPGEFELQDEKVTLFPSQVQVKFKADGDFDNTQDLLNVFWYHLDDAGLGWSPVPEVSYFSYANPDSSVPGGYYIESPYLTQTAPRRCLASGPYRVEIFAGDKLVGEAEAETDFTQMEASTLADLNAALCRPADWDRVTEESLSRPGLVRGYRSPDGSAGTFMFHFNTAGELANLSEADRAAQMLDFAVKNWDIGLRKTPKYDNLAENYFMGLDGGVQNWYTYPGGYVKAGAGVDKDGSVIVGLVYGSTEFFQPGAGNDGPWILSSAIPFTRLIQD
jgi:tetratricopeptide (TPR) repeat protein